MTSNDFLCLMPLIIVAGAPIVMMLTLAVTRNYKLIAGISVIGFLAALISVFFVIPATPYNVRPLLVYDRFSVYIMFIIFFSALLVTLLSIDYVKQQLGEKEEYFIVLFLATLGAAIIALSSHFVTLFLGIETLSISLYILIAYKRQFNQSIEASIKYLILASVSSAFLLFGMALIYTGTGTMEFKELAASFSGQDNISPILMAGFAMIVVGIGFKLALVPFHFWTPDVYQGSPAPVTAFIATASKGAVLAVFIRFFVVVNGLQHPSLVGLISVLAVLSMFTGNFLALKQRNVKRMLAYSSIANLGYLLITLLIGGESGLQTAGFYLASYFITTIGAFGIVSLLSICGQDAELLENYRGLFWKQPVSALVLTLAMLSLAGMPLTIGFMAKFYLVFLGLKSGLLFMVILLLVNSAISLFYYMRVVATMFSSAGDDHVPSLSIIGNSVLVFIAICIIWIGIQPSWLFGLISQIK